MNYITALVNVIHLLSISLPCGKPYMGWLQAGPYYGLANTLTDLGCSMHAVLYTGTMLYSEGWVFNAIVL